MANFLVITSFDTALRSIELIESLPWSVLIVDEAHRLKNPNSKTTTSLSEFAWAPDHPIPSHISQLNSPGAQADQASSSRSPLVEPRTGPMRIALTGTAIQNSYLELWTLLNWANPGMVGSINQWKGFVVKPLTIGQAKGCTEEERLRANVSVSHASSTKRFSLCSTASRANVEREAVTQLFHPQVIQSPSYNQSWNR